MSQINIIKPKGSCYLKFQPAGRFSPGPVAVGASQTLSTVWSIACGPVVDEIQQVLHQKILKIRAGFNVFKKEG